MIAVLLREHRMSLLTDNEMTLFRCLETLTPGQFGSCSSWPPGTTPTNRRV
jgi:hypothetical protein